MGESTSAILEASQLSQLIDALAHRGYQVVGPTVRDGAIVLEPIEAADQLPVGWTDAQKPGSYRLEKRGDEALFGYNVGPQSWKKYLHPADVSLWTAEKQNGAFRILNNPIQSSRPYTFLGVRACELEAIRIQDRVLLGGAYRDTIYENRREGNFLIGVQCTQAADTCFCASMGTGPRCGEGFDLVLTEVLDASRHCFVVKAGSERGRDVLAELQTRPASEEECGAAEKAVERAAKQQVRAMQTDGLKDLLQRNFDHPQWDHVAERCLSCTNCTMVCPTCFCTTVEDSTDLSGEHAERRRHWDSCFTLSFSYIHGGSVRASGKARFRQWMTHKLASWIDQFGTSGCVGCGRCITWCPVGIDITEEVAAIRKGTGNGNA